jgi:glutamine synthetase
MTSETTADRAALRERILQRVRDEHVRFINLQFTDVVGLVKSVTIPAHQFEDAIDHGKWFDGSSIE